MKTYGELKAIIERRGVHPVFGAAGEGWNIEQNAHELATFLVRMQELGVQSVLEVGTGYKGGLSRFLVADMGWDVTTVDVQDYGLAYEGVKYTILSRGYWTPGQYDLVFIDGNHLYKAVMSDYYCYKEHATKAIAFHDVDGQRDCEGVLQFWGELVVQLPMKRLNTVIDHEGNQAGIGWIEL